MNMFKLIYNFIINILKKVFNNKENKKECGEIVETAKLIESDGSTSIHLEYKEKR